MRLDQRKDHQSGFGARAAAGFTLVAMCVLFTIILVRLAQVTG